MKRVKLNNTRLDEDPRIGCKKHTITLNECSFNGAMGRIDPWEDRSKEVLNSLEIFHLVRDSNIKGSA